MSVNIVSQLQSSTFGHYYKPTLQRGLSAIAEILVNSGTVLASVAACDKTPALLQSLIVQWTEAG